MQRDRPGGTEGRGEAQNHTVDVAYLRTQWEGESVKGASGGSEDETVGGGGPSRGLR